MTTKIDLNQSYEAETMVKKLQKAMDSKSPLDDAAPIVYTNKKDGVMPAYDIRTDRFEVARIATEKMAAYEAAKTENLPKIEKSEAEGVAVE